MAKLMCAGSGSSGNSYAIETEEGEILLIECGVKWDKILKMIHFKPSKIVGCLVSHKHGDHSSEFIRILNAGIPVFANDETADHFQIITGEKMTAKPERFTFQCGSFLVSPFYLPHTTKEETGIIISCPNFGYMIRQEEIGTLLYMTDMEYCPYSFKNLAVNHLVIECNYISSMIDRDQGNYAHRVQGHCSLETCKGIIQENMTSSLRTVILIHLSDTASDELQILGEVRNIVGNEVEVHISHAGMAPVSINQYPF